MGKILISKEKILDRQAKFYEELYHEEDNSDEWTSVTENDLEITYYEIEYSMKNTDEIEYSMKKPKKNKSLRIDQIHAVWY